MTMSPPSRDFDDFERSTKRGFQNQPLVPHPTALFWAEPRAVLSAHGVAHDLATRAPPPSPAAVIYNGLVTGRGNYFLCSNVGRAREPGAEGPQCNNLMRSSALLLPLLN